MCNFLRRKDRKNNKDTECFRQSLLKLIFYEEATNFEKNLPFGFDVTE